MSICRLGVGRWILGMVVAHECFSLEIEREVGPRDRHILAGFGFPTTDKKLQSGKRVLRRSDNRDAQGNNAKTKKAF